MSLLLKKLLANRGIEREEDAQKFLYPNYDTDLHDPFLLTDMEKAVERVCVAMRNREKIILYTDYDTDGIPAGVLLHDFFKSIGYTNFENHIPHRNNDGYGLNKNAIQSFIEKGARLIVTADCGITDTEEVQYAQENGVDVIITDHHIPLQNKDGEETLPPAHAVINPKRRGEQYPFQMLCGAGVAFKLVQGIILRGRERGDFQIKEGREKWLLDMVAVATISDRVPLIGENRVLAYYGLKVLRKSLRPGLRRIFQKTFTNQALLTEEDIGFVIGPRINVASRIDIPFKAFRLLATDDSDEAERLVLEINALNEKRKGLVAQMVKEARRGVEERGNRKIIFSGNITWHPGLVGLVAQKLVEEYECPAFVWGRGAGSILKGSCRSAGNLNVVQFMREVRETLADFGGHESSGGFSVLPENLHLFEEKATRLFSERGVQKAVEKNSFIDGEIILDEVTAEMLQEIERLAPFGEGNPRPVFLFKNAIMQDVQFFGKEKKHMKLLLERTGNKPISAIKFFSDKVLHNNFLENKKNVSLKAHVERDMFRGSRGLRLRIVEAETI